MKQACKKLIIYIGVNFGVLKQIMFQIFIRYSSSHVKCTGLIDNQYFEHIHLHVVTYTTIL